METVKILFVGDIVGRPGRRCLSRLLRKVVENYSVDIVIANAENAAGGLGVTPKILSELAGLGIHGFTMGNHTWRKPELARAIDSIANLVRPANYPPGAPGRGSAVIESPSGSRLGIVNVIGRVYMEAFDCPFRAADVELDRLREEVRVILVDVHGEATSEKVAMGWHLDGRCAAVVGTHTHVQTADERILPKGTAYITDVGMTGPRDSVIGVKREIVVNKFITGMPAKFEVAEGAAILNAVVIEASEETGRAQSIERVYQAEEGDA